MLDLRVYGNELNTFKAPNEFGVLTRYYVDEVFPYHVKCHSETGRTECFSAGDLMQIGIIKNKRWWINDFNEGL